MHRKSKKRKDTVVREIEEEAVVKQINTNTIECKQAHEHHIILFLSFFLLT